MAKVCTDRPSGKATQRPEVEGLLAIVREGHAVVVHSMDRLARNLDDLGRIVQGLTQRGVRMEFVKEGLTFTGEDSLMANLMLSVWEPLLSSSRWRHRGAEDRATGGLRLSASHRLKPRHVAPLRATVLGRTQGAGGISR